MAEEQQLRGWSDAGLAARASKFYPVGTSTIWKMKNADPPRRIDLDEADAIGRAFEFKDAMEFVRSSRRDLLLRGLELIPRALEIVDSAHKQLESSMDNVNSLALAIAAAGGAPPDDTTRGALAYLVTEVAESREEYTRIAGGVEASLLRLLEILSTPAETPS